jgi:PilZ domain
MTEAALKEQRAYPRRPMARRAAIFLSPKRQVECTIRNLSRSGAMIQLDAPVDLPKRFVLDLSGNIVVRRVCNLVWQEGATIGVTFAVLRGTQATQLNLD